MLRVALLLLLSTAPAFAAPFDGAWQGVAEKGKVFQYVIHGDEVRFYVKHNGRFVEDRSCSIGIERKGEGAFLVIQECGLAGGGLVANMGGYRLTAKGRNTLHVRYESESGHHEDRGDWVRVR
jgi:hypothetical protein